MKDEVVEGRMEGRKERWERMRVFILVGEGSSGATDLGSCT